MVLENLRNFFGFETENRENLNLGGSLIEPLVDFSTQQITVDRSQVSRFNVFSPQTSTLFSPTTSTFIISESPNASLSGTVSPSNTQSPSQTTSPTFIPVAAGGSIVPASTAADDNVIGDLTGLILIGGIVGLGAVLLLGRGKGRKK